jgi:predicted dehydrogenase
MLEKEKPDLVCIAPRCTDEHRAMALAAVRVGAHVYLEKPITQTLAEADELLALVDRASLRIVVAHQMRLAPNILALKTAIEQGLLGELLEIRSHGKQDHRAGGEDLVVLGVHLFDLMRFIAGDPLTRSRPKTHTRSRRILAQLPGMKSWRSLPLPKGFTRRSSAGQRTACRCSGAGRW